MKQTNVASYVIIAILVLLPFHAVLSTWAGSSFGHLDLFKIWKELLLIPLALYAVYLLWLDKNLAKNWDASWLVRCILGYCLFVTGFAALVLLRHEVTPSAVIYSLLTNLRFVIFFLIVWAVSSQSAIVYRHWKAVLFIPATVVVAFGVLQRFLLPADVLKHFGYGPNTIAAIETVDQKLSLRRIQSSLRGANPLGAYLVVVLTGVAALIRRRWYYVALFMSGLLVMYLTYSRSAWIGLVLALLTLGWLQIKSQRLRKLVVLGALFAGIIGVGLVGSLRHNNTVESVLFHTSQTSQASKSSNEVRSSALKSGLQDVRRQPFGGGPGTAGPSSLRNKLTPARISENYFLQIGQEVGVVGMLLFMVINILAGLQLYKQKDTLSYVLLASLVGITFVNLLSHAWADDTLALLWWGLAGAAIGTPAILKGNKAVKKLSNGQKKQKTKQKNTKT